MVCQQQQLSVSQSSECHWCTNLSLHTHGYKWNLLITIWKLMARNLDEKKSVKPENNPDVDR